MHTLAQMMDAQGYDYDFLYRGWYKKDCIARDRDGNVIDKRSFFPPFGITDKRLHEMLCETRDNAAIHELEIGAGYEVSCM